MKYPTTVMNILEKQMEQLIEMMERGEDPFNQECIDRYYQMYLEMNTGNR